VEPAAVELHDHPGVGVEVVNPTPLAGHTHNPHLCLGARQPDAIQQIEEHCLEFGLARRAAVEVGEDGSCAGGTVPAAGSQPEVGRLDPFERGSSFDQAALDRSTEPARRHRRPEVDECPFEGRDRESAAARDIDPVQPRSVHRRQGRSAAGSLTDSEVQPLLVDALDTVRPAGRVVAERRVWQRHERRRGPHRRRLRRSGEDQHAVGQPPPCSAAYEPLALAGRHADGIEVLRPEYPVARMSTSAQGLVVDHRSSPDRFDQGKST